jgi:hypothetical protein
MTSAEAAVEEVKKYCRLRRAVSSPLAPGILIYCTVKPLLRRTPVIPITPFVRYIFWNDSEYYANTDICDIVSKSPDIGLSRVKLIEYKPLMLYLYRIL